MKLSRLTSLVALVAFSLSIGATASGAILISDFSAPNVPTNVNHPNPANAGTNANAPVYHDISQDAFATAAGGTLAGSPALKIDDGGFTNGVYTIYAGVVPATGVYNVSADMLVNDTATSQMTAYQMGVIVNGVHRGANPSKIANAPLVANYPLTLTSGALDATSIQTINTPLFAANAGDSLLIAFSTDVADGYDSNAGFWNSASVLVDNIMLNPVPEPATLALAGLGLLGLVAARRRSA